MHYRITHTHINFQQNRFTRSVNTVHTILFAKKIVSIDLQIPIRVFEKPRHSNMHYLSADMQAVFEFNWPIDFKLW